MNNINSETIGSVIAEIVNETPVHDLHTHLYPPTFGPLFLWGVDELVTYHYLAAELFRFWPGTPEAFFKLSTTEQADLIWETLFVRNSPVSEAAIGVLTTLAALGLDPGSKDLREARAYFAKTNAQEHLDHVLSLAKVSGITMTNDPLDSRERQYWENSAFRDPRLHAVLRIDPVLNGWPGTVPALQSLGYRVTPSLDDACLTEVRRYLEEWAERMFPQYVAVSFPDTFAYPEQSDRITLLTEAVLPVCLKLRLPFAMMIGVRKQANPRLGSAGDSVGYADVGCVEASAQIGPPIASLSPC